MPIAITRPFDLTGMGFGEVLGDGAFQLAFACFFVFFFFNNGIGPGWHATIIDANRVETRESMLSIATFLEEFGEGLGILIGGLVRDALVVGGSTIPYGQTYLWLTLTLIASIGMWIPLAKNIRLDIARVDAYNHQVAVELEQARKK